MYPNLSLVLIFFSIISLLASCYMLYLSFRSVDTLGKQIAQTAAKRNINETWFSFITYGTLLYGSIQLYHDKPIGKTIVLIVLSLSLIYIWLKNMVKIIFSRKLAQMNISELKAKVDAEALQLIEPKREDMMEEIDFDQEFYTIALRKSQQKAIGRLVVGTLLFGWAIFILLS